MLKARFGCGLPLDIRKEIDDQTGSVDQIGMSDSMVIMYENRVLKVQSRTEETDNEQKTDSVYMMSFCEAFSSFSSSLRIGEG